MGAGSGLMYIVSGVCGPVMRFTVKCGIVQIVLRRHAVRRLCSDWDVYPSIARPSPSVGR